MCFERLKHLSQDRTLLEQVVEPCHVHGIQQVDLEEVVVPHVVAEEWHAFDRTDVCHER